VTVRLEFRSVQASDLDWLVEIDNDPETSRYGISIYPRTEHDIGEFLKKALEEAKSKEIVAVVDGEPAGSVEVWTSMGRDRHVAWLGIAVRRKHWGKGVGTALMKEAVRLAKELGCRKLMLGTTEGNERAIRLYKKVGFEQEACEDDEVYIDGSWRKNFIMGLELAPCEPMFESAALLQASTTTPVETSEGDIQVRQLMNKDLDELHRLQNCPESTKSTKKIPPVTKEETKRWYEELKSADGKYCLASFQNDKLLGYLRFRSGPLPFPSLKIEETIVDVNQIPHESANALVTALKGFRERYGYRKIFAYVPETSGPIITALEQHGFKKNGAMRNIYLIDGHYVNVALYGYP